MVGLSFMWNSLHVIILPAVLLQYVPGTLKNTYLGLLTFAGLVIAMIVQPIAGAASDRWVSRWGRRRPLILAGTLFDFIFLAILGYAGGVLWLAIGYIGLQLSSNTAHGPAQGLLPDRVPAEQIGAGSGIKNLMDMGGLVVSSLVVGRLLDPNATRATLPMAVVAGVLALGTIITLVGAKERPVLSRPARAENEPAVTRNAPSSKGSLSPYWWLVGSRYVFLLGIFDVQVFAQYYIRDVIHAANPVKLTGDLLAVITLSLVAFAVAGGWLGDRLGHKRMLWVASGLGAAGCLLLLGARTPGTLLGFGSVLGIGIGLFLTSNWALANRLAPHEQAGKYLGLTNLATAGAGATGRLLGPLIDLLNNANPGAYNGYTMMFLFGAACAVVSAVVLRKVRESG
jgi:MFS family permease